MHQIHDSLLPLAVAVDALVPDPENARLHNERNLDAIAASLRAFGQRKPIVVQRTGGSLVVRAGNGTLEAATRLGWTKVAAVVIDEDDSVAAAFAIADNRTAELAEWDDAALSAMVNRLEDGGEWGDVLGTWAFTISGGEVVLPTPAFPAPSGPTEPRALVAPEEFPSYDENVKTAHSCPRCGYEWG